MGLRDNWLKHLRKQFPDIPARRSEIIDMIAKEFPWKLNTEGAAALPLEVVMHDQRFVALRQALEPALQAPKTKMGMFQRNILPKKRDDYLTRVMREDRFFSHVEASGPALKAETDYRVAEGVTNPKLLAAIKKYHPALADAKIPTEVELLGGMEPIRRVANIQEAPLSSLSGAEMITRGNQKPPRELGS